MSKEGAGKKGLMSSYIQRMKKMFSINPMFFRGLTRISIMKMPVNEIPLIIVTVGAGIARFRGLFQEREEEKTGEVLVFYSAKGNSVLVDELNDWVNKKVISKLFIVLSNGVTGKKHVQDLIKENKDQVYDTIKKDAIIMICANLSIEEEVKIALIDVLTGKEENPKEFLENMKKQTKYVKELWS